MRYRVAFGRYVLAIAAVVCSTAVRYSLSLFEEKILFYAAYYPAILIAAFWGGVGPGIFATVLSLLTVWFLFIPPTYSFAILDRAQFINLFLFLTSASLIIWVANSYRKALADVADGEETRKLLVREMEHRTRNSLSVSKSVIDQTLKHDPDTARNLFARLRLLLETERLLGEQERDRDIKGLLSEALTCYGRDRVVLRGEAVLLPPKRAKNLALIAHELATNSAKYGALSVCDGRLVVQWRVDGERLTIDWRETGSSEQTARRPGSGFGSKLIDAMVRDARGEIIRECEPGFYHCLITMSLNDQN